MTRDDTFRELVRAAADPGLPDGAAARIADRAWARAEELRRTGADVLPLFRDAATSPSRTTMLQRRAHLARRILPFGWRASPASGRFAGRPLGLSIAAAAALVLGLLVLLRGSEPAFAVDGDPVQVEDGGTWRTAADRVPVGAWVFAGPAVRTRVRCGDGSVVEPRGGTVFRIRRGDGPGTTWRVDLRCGDADVSGSAIALDLSDAMQVASDGRAAFLHVTASLGSALDAPPDVARIAGMSGRLPSVTVRIGSARVIGPDGTEHLVLGPEQSAAAISFGSDPGDRRIVRESPWTPDVAIDLLRGARFLGTADGGREGVALVCTSQDAGIRAFHVAPQDGPRVLREIEQVRAAATLLAFRFTAVADAVIDAGDEDAWRTEYVHGRGADRTRIAVLEDGSATLERPGHAPERFASLAALRTAAPDSAALFGDALK